jgi:hypothetical protein
VVRRRSAPPRRSFYVRMDARCSPGRVGSPGAMNGGRSRPNGRRRRPWPLSRAGERARETKTSALTLLPWPGGPRVALDPTRQPLNAWPRFATSFKWKRKLQSALLFTESVFWASSALSTFPLARKRIFSLFQRRIRFLSQKAYFSFYASVLSTQGPGCEYYFYRKVPDSLHIITPQP